jgi:hypothetical protein
MREKFAPRKNKTRRQLLWWRFDNFAVSAWCFDTAHQAGAPGCHIPTTSRTGAGSHRSDLHNREKHLEETCTTSGTGHHQKLDHGAAS